MKKFLLGLLAVISLGAQAASFRVGDVVNIPENAWLCRDTTLLYELYDAVKKDNKVKAVRLVDGELCSLAKGGKAFVQFVGDAVLKVGQTPSSSDGGVWIFKNKDLKKD